MADVEDGEEPCALASHSGSAGSKQAGDKMFSLKKWNAVAMWSWDVECDTCAICRVQVMGKRRAGRAWGAEGTRGGRAGPGRAGWGAGGAGSTRRGPASAARETPGLRGRGAGRPEQLRGGVGGSPQRAAGVTDRLRSLG